MMSEFDPDRVATSRERAILIGVDRPNTKFTIDSSLSELARLAHTAGADVVATITQRMHTPNPATFIGSGKAMQVSEMASSLDTDMIIFDDELTPSQQSNLEKLMGEDVKVIDRTALILDIFALHAKSREGRLQVALAQSEYLYPRLRGMWAHLASNRMGGGVGSRFGEGESQLEVDRRMVRKKITSIRKELADLKSIRALQRGSRKRSGVYKIALAGYTNAGKSSLLNRICDADVYSDDLLFATLDSTTRAFKLADGRRATLTDTVGFIQKLPTTLVEAFRSTLDEITVSDLILHVVDASSKDFETQIDAVHEVFSQIHADVIPTIFVFNKIDLLDENTLHGLRRRYSAAQFVSSKTGDGVEDLISRISVAASSADALMRVTIPFSKGELVSLAHNRCYIAEEDFSEAGTIMTLRVPVDLVARFAEYEA